MLLGPNLEKCFSTSAGASHVTDHFATSVITRHSEPSLGPRGRAQDDMLTDGRAMVFSNAVSLFYMLFSSLEERFISPQAVLEGPPF